MIASTSVLKHRIPMFEPGFILNTSISQTIESTSVLDFRILTLNSSFYKTNDSDTNPVPKWLKSGFILNPTISQIIHFTSILNTILKRLSMGSLWTLKFLKWLTLPLFWILEYVNNSLDSLWTLQFLKWLTLQLNLTSTIYQTKLLHTDMIDPNSVLNSRTTKLSDNWLLISY